MVILVDKGIEIEAGTIEPTTSKFYHSYSTGSIIEGDQNQVAAFSLEYFSNLTRSAWAYENASGSFLINRPALAL